MTRVRVLETRSVRAPLGVRLLDPLHDRPVRGLVVTARPLEAPRVITTAVETPTGNYGLHTIRGIPPLVDGSDAPKRPIAVQAIDPTGRYVPAVYRLDAPDDELPAIPDDGAGLYVFPSVTHPAPAGTVCVRGWLAHAATGEPAAHAVLEVRLGATRAVGIADEDGSVAVLLPAPVVEGPPDDVRAAWPVAVDARWAPDEHEHVADLDVPTTRSLIGQSAATVDGLPADLTVTEGRPLVISSDTDASRRLLLTPA